MTAGIAHEINQVFINILTSAIKAIEGEGGVTIRTEVADGSVCVSIADTGMGMSSELQSRIFEPFFAPLTLPKCLCIFLAVVLPGKDFRAGSMDERPHLVPETSLRTR